MDYKNWERHFKNNYDHLDHISFENDQVTKEEIEIITKSIQQFQRGENSEGKHLIEFAKNSSFERYHETIIHFIREEQRHAMILGKWMKQHGIDRIQDHWVDRVFRKMRRLTNLENSIRILLTAEIIAAVYYKGLRDATSSPTLKSICNQILIDEDIHLDFQYYTLSHFQHNRNRISQVFQNWKQKTLLAGTILVVWKEHRIVLKKGGYNLFNFSSEVFQILNRCLIAMTNINVLSNLELKLQQVEFPN